MACAIPTGSGGTVTENVTVAPADPNTGAGLIEFLDAAIDKGWFNVASVKALRTATLKILEVESGWEGTDLRTLDVEGLFGRFRNLKRNAYSDDSMRVYKNRFGQALKMHLARLEGDANWKAYGPAARAGSPSKPPTNGGKTARRSSSAEVTLIHSGPDAAIEDGDQVSPQDAGSGSVPLMRYPFPLRATVDAWLTLPRDVTKEEADRLSVFIRSLARQDTTSSVSARESAAS
jgi:hypothetical protein